MGALGKDSGFRGDGFPALVETVSSSRGWGSCFRLTSYKVRRSMLAVISYRLLSCPVMSCRFLSCPVMSSPVMSRPVISCPVMPVMSSAVISTSDFGFPASWESAASGSQKISVPGEEKTQMTSSGIEPASFREESYEGKSFLTRLSWT